ncbi:RNA-binding domain-containing protein [Daldinia decipiens]|uniref:RNA-binding domain-containing protein n=1 Tax=Daldinia decipiens TaxID=326647 RepID=UPI0020C2ED5D|nr:RNA-binding domain-containing protein [Daldinia decipiens]KAI1657882.1 RNA-binding domain-containing protein [Daldinia decipiens]
MDRSLDEIVAESQHKKRGSRPRRGGGGRPRERDSYPRDGVRKSTRDDSRNLDSEWVHDKFDDPSSRNRPRHPRQRSPDRFQETRGTKVKVENLHYELTEDDLDGLFNKIGPVVKLELLYDRAGRSEGTAFITYENRDDAMEAIKQYDNANAKGQPIRLSVVSSAPRRNPFDTAHMPGRSLAESITRPRSLSPRRYSERDRGVDRYVPGGGSRSRSPLPRRRGGGGGRRPGAQREGREGRGGREGREGREGGGTPNGRERAGRDGRPKKTQEELDAEMADYFNPSGSNDTAPAAETAGAIVSAIDDVDMIE